MSTDWDVMRQYEERMKELREEAEEEGIEVSEASISNTMDLLYALSPPGTDPTEEPSRLLKHGEVSDSDDDEWRLP